MCAATSLSDIFVPADTFVADVESACLGCVPRSVFQPPTVVYRFVRPEDAWPEVIETVVFNHRPNVLARESAIERSADRVGTTACPRSVFCSPLGAATP